MYKIRKYSEVNDVNRAGKVIEVYEDKRAKILMRKHTACEGCGACQYGKEKMNMEIIALNELGAQVGDTVEISMRVYNVLGAAFIAYVFPLIMLIFGVFFGNFILKKMGFDKNLELYSILIGFVLLILTYVILKIYENNLKGDKKYTPIVSKIIQ